MKSLLTFAGWKGKQPHLHHRNSIHSTWTRPIFARIADEITATGFAFIMTSRVRNHVVIRLSICSHRTALHDIEMVFERLTQIGQDLYQENPLREL